MFSFFHRAKSASKMTRRCAATRKLELEALEDRRLLSGFADGFEAPTLDPFWATVTNSGSVALTPTGPAHSGSQSVQLSSVQTGSQKSIDIHHDFAKPVYGRVSVWVYDTGAGESSSNYIGFGVLNLAEGTAAGLGTQDYDLGPTNGGTYGYGSSYGASSGGATPIVRTKAWHQFVIDAAPAAFKIMIDGVQVYADGGGHQFDRVRLEIHGPDWRPAWTAYFDDFAFTPYGTDIAATKLAWNTAQGGVDFGYKVSGAALTQDTTAQLYWASGTTTDTILKPATAAIPIPQTVPVDQEQTVHLAPSDLTGGPAPGAMYLLAVVDPDNKIDESDETNNVASLALPVIPEVDIALNPTRVGYPTPLESDHGWGGGSDPWEIVDGHESYSEWYHGLAFTGGDNNWGGEPAGPRQATIDFGTARTFNKVVIWQHGSAHTPASPNLDYYDGASWKPISFQRVYGATHAVGANSGDSWSDEYTFSAVTGTRVRYSFDNSGLNIDGTQIIHGWIYEFQVLAPVATVKSAAVNGNNAALAGAQRSMVNSLVYTFDHAVTLGSNAFTIALHTNVTVNGTTGRPVGTLPTLSWSSPDGGLSWVVTFSGAGVVGGSIADGVYDLTLHASAVTDFLGNALAADQVDTFWRLYGDSNGDGTVNNADTFQLRATFGASPGDAAYLAYLDYSGTGAINNADVFQFRKRFGTTFSGFTPTL
jgi:hypothetical protein